MPTERRYTVAEIEEMRGLVEYLNTEFGVPYNPTELSAKIEDQLRTYMVGGTSVDELKAAVAAKRETDRHNADLKCQWLKEKYELEKPQREARDAEALELKTSHRILECLDVEISERSYRCDRCKIMQPASSGQAWVLDGTTTKDPVEVTRQRHLNKGGNYHASAWCLSCCPKEPSVVAPPIAETLRGSGSRLHAWLFGDNRP